MVADKKKRSDLAVPGWVKDRWNQGTNEKDEMAHLLQHVNWVKESTGLGFACLILCSLRAWYYAH